MIELSSIHTEEINLKWNPYPQTLPPKAGRYLVTIDNLGRTVTIDVYYLEFKTQKYYWSGWDGFVIAWAELPKPYEEK